MFNKMRMAQVMNRWRPFTKYFSIRKGAVNKFCDDALMVIRLNIRTIGEFVEKFQGMERILKHRENFAFMKLDSEEFKLKTLKY